MTGGVILGNLTGEAEILASQSSLENFPTHHTVLVDLGAFANERLRIRQIEWRLILSTDLETVCQL